MRQKGFYWVKLRPGREWEVAEWVVNGHLNRPETNDYWMIFGTTYPFKDDYFEAINENNLTPPE